MAELKSKLLQDLSDTVLDMDEEKAVETSHQVIEAGIDAYEAIDQGLAHGMARAGELFEQEEYFIPEILMCADAMYAGLEVLRPYLKPREEGEKVKVVIGVIEGDTHDIGKNMVKIMLETSGFEVHDLGRDVPPQRFVERAHEVSAQIIGISTLMTTTMDGMGEVVRLLEARQIRNRFKVIVGGGPISQRFADQIGADGYAANAADAVKLARRLVS
ncbi:cobalamin-binding protein [Heliobacterium undosum]|uniref:Cobalamin-binding protein n=1 Tax=Heliomicrobium undosum TaxID=121734 RepID=A0A845L149_9FIRM|nr:corrinoid protein [Heliomicrobium undosum]MZP29933.1 cobalamin-binding protein [Heliomicrobium undosum]